MKNMGAGYASRIVLSACIAALLFCLPYYCWGQSGETFGNIYTGLDALETLLSAMEERNATLLSSVTDLNQTLQTQEQVLVEQRRLTAARTSVERITAELDGNVRSIQEAKRIIGNIRAAVEELEAGLLAGDSGGGGAGLDGGPPAGALE
jgi:hypothetical protein